MNNQMEPDDELPVDFNVTVEGVEVSEKYNLDTDNKALNAVNEVFRNQSSNIFAHLVLLLDILKINQLRIKVKVLPTDKELAYFKHGITMDIYRLRSYRS